MNDKKEIIKMNRFVDEKKEYLITNMYPKRPWMNYA